MKKQLHFIKKVIASLCLLPALAFSANAQITITEIMYDSPESGADTLEFIEMVNTSGSTINLYLYSMAGINHTFTANDSILDDQYYVGASDSAAFRNVYGFDADFVWGAGSLNNTGSYIDIRDTFGVYVDSLTYGNSAPWDSRANAGGPSLVLCDSLSDNNDGANWYAAQTPVIGATINGLQLYANPGVGASCFKIDYSVDTAIFCYGGNEGVVIISQTGGASPVSYLWNTGDTVAHVDSLSSATYSVVATDNNGVVDSITFFLNEPALLSDTLVQSACASYTWAANSNVYTMSGMYYDTTSSTNGCDSISVLDLSIDNSDSSFVISVCDSSYFIWQGDTLTSSGVYLDTLQNAAMCDSLLSLTLTLSAPSASADTVITCGSYIWQGDTLTMAGDYIDTIPNAGGCDSILSLNLSFSTPSSSTDSVTACAQYIWFGDTLTMSGTYFDTIASSIMGCDSMLTLKLNILNSTTATVRDTACDNYSWSLSGMTYNTSGSYTYVDTNSLGCDSIITLELIIKNSTASSESQDVCNSYTWPQNGMTYTKSGIYTDTITNSIGCDSVISLDLTVRKANSSIIKRDFILISQQTNATSYQWLDCLNGDTAIAGATGQSYLVEKNGSYAVRVEFDGCVDTSFCLNVVNVGIEEMKLENNFSIHPNPAKNYITLELASNQLNASILQILDITGGLVKEFEVSAKKQQFDVSSLNNGVYIIRYGNKMKKLIISN